MAAQFESFPNATDFQSTADPLIFQVYETSAGPFFKYRFILVVQVGGATVATLKTHPLSESNLSAVFDLSRICDDYIGPNVVNSNSTAANVLTLGRTGFDPADVIGTSYQQQPAREFTVELYYETATSATTEPTQSALQATKTFFAFRDEFINDGLAYTRGDGTYQPDDPDDNFLSSAPDLGVVSGWGAAYGNVKEHRIGIDQAYVLAYGAEGSTATYVYIRGFEADGTVVGTASLDIDNVGGETTPTTDEQAVQYIGVGPANLEDHATAAGNTDLTNLITDTDLAYYELYLSSSLSSSQSFQSCMVHRFTIDNGCSKYPRIQLLFLNRHGGWDCFNFDQRSEESLRNITRSQYNRPRGNWDTVSAATDWSYSGYERGVTTTNVKAEKQVRVSTDYIDEGYNQHLRDIALSRAVFTVEGTNLIPVTVTDSEYLFKTTVNEKLISYSFTLQYSNRPRLK